MSCGRPGKALRPGPEPNSAIFGRTIAKTVAPVRLPNCRLMTAYKKTEADFSLQSAGLNQNPHAFSLNSTSLQ